MRIGLLIRDHEYRNALAERISDYDSDILLDVIGPSCTVERDALILTDAKPADLGNDLMEKIKERTIFLTNEERIIATDFDRNLHKIFKYSGVSRLMAYISEIYASWQGRTGHKYAVSKVIACCFDSDAFSAGRCSSLASQIAYTQGGSIIILPLGYINEYAVDYGRDINSFARLMYMVKAGRELDKLSISYIDNYGVNRLVIPRGRNPVAYLDNEDLEMLIMAVCKLFDTVVLDIGSCYREENLNAIRNADRVLCFETGRKRIDFSSLTGKENSERMKVIKLNADGDEAFALDDYIKEIYGAGDVR